MCGFVVTNIRWEIKKTSQSRMYRIPRWRPWCYSQYNDSKSTSCSVYMYEPQQSLSALSSPRCIITGMASGSIVLFYNDFNRWHHEYQTRYWGRTTTTIPENLVNVGPTYCNPVIPCTKALLNTYWYPECILREEKLSDSVKRSKLFLKKGHCYIL